MTRLQRLTTTFLFLHLAFADRITNLNRPHALKARDLRNIRNVANWGVCLNATNSCQRDYPKRCRLNSTITEDAPIPAWVTQDHRDLVEKTVIIARNGNPWPAGDNGDMMHIDYADSRACVSFAGKLRWSVPRSDELETPCLPGFVSLGYHPFGTHNGTWLTQILAYAEPIANWTDYGENHTLLDGFYVNITYISDQLPGEGFLELGPTREVLDEVRDLHPFSSFFRTDQDLIARGFDYYCCGKWHSAKSNGGHDVDCVSLQAAHQDCRPINETGRNSPVSATGNSNGLLEYSYNSPSCPGVVKPTASDAGKVMISSGLLSLLGVLLSLSF